jgi:hypothetical protein
MLSPRIPCFSTVRFRIASEAQLNSQLPIVWTGKDWNGMCQLSLAEKLAWLVGCAITVLANPLAAPFWFDVLNKVATVRFNGQSPAKGQPPAAP